MPTITDREAEIILDTMKNIRIESRNPKARMIRISNLADKVTVIINRSKRRNTCPNKTHTNT